MKQENPGQWASRHFEHLKEEGFDIDACLIDFARISVDCHDLARYKKAFRVRIRALMKTAETEALNQCMERFYAFAQFVRYLYGFHSCAVPVAPWQVAVAKKLQVSMALSFTPYQRGEWVTYEPRLAHEERLRAFADPSAANEAFIQDEKPFLTLKDKAHFEKHYCR